MHAAVTSAAAEAVRTLQTVQRKGGHPSTENKSDHINLSETLHLTQPQEQQNILRKGSTMAGELKTAVSCTTMKLWILKNPTPDCQKLLLRTPYER